MESLCANAVAANASSCENYTDKIGAMIANMGMTREIMESIFAPFSGWAALAWSVVWSVVELAAEEGCWSRADFRLRIPQRKDSGIRLDGGIVGRDDWGGGTLETR